MAVEGHQVRDEPRAPSRTRSLTAVLCLAACSWAGAGAGRSPGSGAGAQSWLRSFPVEVSELTTSGENPFFILKPGYQLTFAKPGAGNSLTLVITVLNETKNVGGVDTRVVEERESKGGELVEVSRNYFAISPKTGDVYYFGEDVDMYRKGKIVSHEGAWQYGKGGAMFGLMMPAKPAVGSRFYQEQAKGIAMDRAEIVSLTERLQTPAGSFERVLKVKETTPLEPLVREYKFYAPGVGLIKDGEVELVSKKYL
jgi:hypothetical protein